MFFFVVETDDIGSGFLVPAINRKIPLQFSNKFKASDHSSLGIFLVYQMSVVDYQ